MAPPTFKHNRIVRKVFKAIEASLDKSGAGEAYVEAGEILSRIPATMRIPDISFVSNERIKVTAEEGYLEGAPDLAVEVFSPSQSAADLDVKVRQYLQFGAKQVSVLYPKTKSIHVFRPGLAPEILEQSQMLDGGDVVAGIFGPSCRPFPLTHGNRDRIRGQLDQSGAELPIDFGGQDVSGLACDRDRLPA